MITGKVSTRTYAGKDFFVELTVDKRSVVVRAAVLDCVTLKTPISRSLPPDRGVCL